MNKLYKCFVFVCAVCLLIIPCLMPVNASTDLKVTSDKTLTAKFNNYDNVTVTEGKTLTLAKRSGEPVGLEVSKSLVVEEGAKITGAGLLIFDCDAKVSGITLYYKYNGEYRAIPKGYTFSKLSADKDYKATFSYVESKGIYVLEAEFNGGDPFGLELTRWITVVKKDTYQLDLSGITEGIKWSSADKSVATVNSKGVVTGKSVGNTVITATYEGKNYTCEVEVVAKGLSSTTLYMNKGDKFSIKLYGSEIKSVSSSNKKIAKINKKLQITAVADGTCKITVKGTDGKKYKCTVYVGNANVGNQNNNDNTGIDGDNNADKEQGSVNNTVSE